MTIHDLTWSPARIGEGIIAVEHFPDGVTVYVRFEHDAYNFTSFKRDKRVLKNRQGISRDEVNRLLNSQAFISSSKRV